MKGYLVKEGSAAVTGAGVLRHSVHDGDVGVEEVGGWIVGGRDGQVDVLEVAREAGPHMGHAPAHGQGLLADIDEVALGREAGRVDARVEGH